MLTEELLLIGSMAYLDYAFKEYAGAACPTKTTLDTGAVTCDLSGATNMYAPEISASITLGYVTPLVDIFDLHVTMDPLCQDSCHPLNSTQWRLVSDKWPVIPASVKRQS